MQIATALEECDDTCSSLSTPLGLHPRLSNLHLVPARPTHSALPILTARPTAKAKYPKQLPCPILRSPPGPRHPDQRPPRWCRAAPAPCCTPRPSPWPRLRGGRKQVLSRPQPAKSLQQVCTNEVAAPPCRAAGRPCYWSGGPHRTIHRHGLSGEQAPGTRQRLPQLTAAQQADRLQGRRLVDLGHRHLVHHGVLCRVNDRGRRIRVCCAARRISCNTSCSAAARHGQEPVIQSEPPNPAQWM